MQLYILLASDRLEEKQENQLKENLPAIREAIENYIAEKDLPTLKMINHCDSDMCEDWQLGFEQPIKKNKQLQTPINFCNDLAEKFNLDFEVGFVEDETHEAVCYFGAEEGPGDTFMIAQYLDL
ncbi:MAG: hypothetical protein HRU20_20220 [Pseudomonadales bacterium]|nr:hypothetical protein [Pseudomonadales bacterium]